MGLMDKANELSSAEQGEQMSDQVIQEGGGLADTMTGGKFADKIDEGQAFADERIGMPNAAMQAPDMRPEDQQ